MNVIERLSKSARRNTGRILLTITVISGLAYAFGVIGGALGIARLAAIVFAGSATADIVDDTCPARPQGTAMVSIAGFMLLLEGGAHAIAEEMTQVTFLEIGLGLYLLVAVWSIVRK